MRPEILDDAQLDTVTGGRFLPRLRAWAPAIGFVAAALALKPVADTMVERGIGVLHVPPARRAE